ncbi:hypothetical protein RF679_11660 [Undibacterium cyanobacteriorum]|uniref:Integral membrane protein n=1 Tax=Undibacterium cyanobacteriorum TaxID=3073561 RepID=A0ABY9RDP9_9BURK|nr:hypothetical protein [Undibacterium sp. 20NA77.5]WMW79304.1 hypothetical protein RF679_11660 [Undibacterium sp. 20NA77.5]
MFAAIVFTALSVFVILFQLALVFGAPWGEWTLGGKWRGALPARVRLIPVISIFIIAFFVGIALARAGVAMQAWSEWSQKGIWIVVAYCALGVVANSATPSKRERRLWVPVLVVLLSSSLYLALQT